VRAHIAVTPGDPRGIGPEVALRALERFESEDPDVEVVLVGPEGAVARAEVATDPVRWHGWVGGGDAEAGQLAGRAIERAVALALSGEALAIVTAPLHKPSLQAAGWAVAGQTEMLRDLAGSGSVGMLMAAERTRLGSPLRVLLATRHIPLRDVPDALSAAVLVEQSTLLNDALRTDWGLRSPRLALCALNPHASDGGLFGSEEADVYAPALERIRARGVEAEGPLPADTVFARALAGDFDAVVAPYHDVGMAAFKTVAFGTGVNVTIGLPFVRTSPDHGTAFDLAGTGRADAASMLEALRLAARLSRARFDTTSADVLT
jgi:4-hydroxythreonine-4-phosphate dehydrogenase